MSFTDFISAEEARDRLRSAQDERAGARPHARCRGCRTQIPDERDRRALYCSFACQNRTKARCRKRLVREIELARRAETPRLCSVCGGAIAPEQKAGTIFCGRRCRQLDYSRRHAGEHSAARTAAKLGHRAALARICCVCSRPIATTLRLGTRYCGGGCRRKAAQAARPSRSATSPDPDHAVEVVSEAPQEVGAR